MNDNQNQNLKDVIEVTERFYENKRFLPNIETECFLKLPRRCQEMIFEQLTRRDGLGYKPFEVYGLPGEIKSPIEQMFYLAFSVVNLEFYNGRYAIEEQVEIIAFDKKYYADFQLLLGSGEKLMLIVECDGHDFHKTTKEQIKHDNERDFALKKSGYDVIHFSGSQLYENAWKCADDVCSYIQERYGV